MRRKFEALEKEIGDARTANAALRARLDGGAAPPPMETEDRFAYLRNLMMEFLADPEPDARAHMERAILVVLGFDADDEARLAAKRGEAAAKKGGGLLGFFG